MTATPRVVVTGMGLVSAAGSSMAALQDSLQRRRHCLDPISRFDTIGMTATHAGEVADFAPLAHLPPSRASTVDRGTQLALAAARQALAQAGLPAAAAALAGVAIGVSGSTQYQNMRVTSDRGYPTTRLSALYTARSTPAFQADAVAQAFELGGPRFAFGSASLGGLLALSHAMDLLHAGLAPAMLVGGGEINTLMNALGMGALGVTAVGPCTPFAGPGGICFGEGAAFFVLEPLAEAERRGAVALGELLATGISADAYSEVAQSPSGSGLARAVRKSLDKRASPQPIGWIRGCGTGQRELDAAEAIGLNTAFAGAVPPVTSTEPYFSHVNGVSPLLGLAAVLAAFASDRAPAQPDPLTPRPGLAMALLEPGRLPPGDCLLTATAFGGTNGAVVVRRADPAIPPVGRAPDSDPAIVVAGMGAVSPLGGTLASLLEALEAPAAPGDATRRVDDAWLDRRIAGISMRRRERMIRMVLLAAADALADAGLAPQEKSRIGLMIGLVRGPAAAYERFFAKALDGRFDITTGRLLLRVGRFAVASEIAHAFGLLGYSGVLAPGVHGGVQLLAHGAELLRASDDLDALLVIAADEWTGLQEALYRRLGLLGDGAAYAASASGCVLGEGAAAIVLCRRPAVARDWAVIEGSGFAGDTTRVPDAQGRAYARAMSTAIGRAGRRPADIGLVVGQGCGWPTHDRRELAAVARICPGVPVTSVLSRTGLVESAGGLFGAMAAAAALRDGRRLAGPSALLVGSSERGAHAAVVLSRIAA